MQHYLHGGWNFGSYLRLDSSTTDTTPGHYTTTAYLPATLHGGAYPTLGGWLMPRFTFPHICILPPGFLDKPDGLVDTPPPFGCVTRGETGWWTFYARACEQFAAVL